MPIDLETLGREAKTALESAQNLKELDNIFHAYLGRKGKLTAVLRSLGTLTKEERTQIGKEANETKEMLAKIFEQRKNDLLREENRRSEEKEWIDVTAPGKKLTRGHLHPLTLIQRKAVEIFQDMGFAVVEGPEIESEWYNFDALNIPKNHPARDMWDTFWLNPKFLLRTHTSPVQIRYMEKHNPPFRIVAPGRIFRYEATDARHEINFYQLEGLMVGKDISAANFKAILETFYQRIFQAPTKIRLRPSYFPFTEPSFEVDMQCILCRGGGCSSCGQAGWMEMMGAGMVHPNVFKAVRYNPGEWQGFAFGMGLDRLAMMKFGIPDIRLFYGGDLRLLQQF
ncbi:MAG: phenylalanine--tRNA ligase subunit alpha [Candidatus Wildermuthbacteria bacterium]|nr:phenylalanine--tRNA ligase subunit alpha [Candidatus Wildermuthbacteria bacterium]